MIVFSTIALLGARASAFDDPTQFLAQSDTPHAAVTSASAEGIYFTGAPRFADQGCPACHVAGPGLARVKLGADDPSLFSDGYSPGQLYEIEVELLSETAGLDHGGSTCTEPPPRAGQYPYVQCNNNNFALEIDYSGVPLSGQGYYCAVKPTASGCPAPSPLTDESFVTPDGDAVLGNRTHDPANPHTVTRNGATSWHFFWTAPQAGTGPLDVHVALVDGNGGGGTADNDQDPLNDDTVVADISIPEAGASGLAPVTASSCAVGGRASANGLWCFLVLLGLAVAQRRRSKR